MHKISQINAPKLHLISLGCSKNLVDSEVMLGRLQCCSLTDNISEADVIIINTCGFIQSAKQESIRTILEASNMRKNGAILVVSGCLSERYAKELEEEIKEIDIIIGVRDYATIDSLLTQKGIVLPNFVPTKTKNNAISAPKPLDSSTRNNADKGSTDSSSLNSIGYRNHPQNLASNQKVFLANEHHKRIITGSRIHAYIKLSEGCNQQCSFCSIPSFKGKLQSRSIQSILNEVESLAKEGFMDFSFIAQDSSSYLQDFGQKDGLVALIKALDAQAIARNARIHYLYPTSTSEKLIETIAASNIIQNYFDIPIQHIADSMLARMRRNIRKKRLKELLSLMRQTSNAFLRSTLIVGHPGESQEEFDELCEFVEEGIFDRLNLFAFSSEEGTLAHTMAEKIQTKTINARLNALNKILRTQDKHCYQTLKNTTLEVLLEGKSSISEYFYSARDKRWGLEIDGEILINESDIEYPKAGLYEAYISEYKYGLLFGKLTRAL